eukprot:5395178-Alexandrium_andersonii.AAC.1
MCTSNTLARRLKYSEGATETSLPPHLLSLALTASAYPTPGFWHGAGFLALLCPDLAIPSPADLVTI